MNGNGDTTTHVTDNQVQVFVTLAYLSGIAASDGPLVKGVPDADAIHQRRA